MTSENMIDDVWGEFDAGSLRPSGGSRGGNARPPVAELEDGEYRCRVVSVDYFESQKGAFYRWGLEVTDGLRSGAYFEKFQSASRIGLKILAEDLLLLTGGLPSKEAVYDKETNSAGAIVSEVKDKPVKVRQVTKANGYPNFYFNDAGAADAVDDDIPF